MKLYLQKRGYKTECRADTANISMVDVSISLTGKKIIISGYVFYNYKTECRADTANISMVDVSISLTGNRFTDRL